VEIETPSATHASTARSTWTRAWTSSSP